MTVRHAIRLFVVVLLATTASTAAKVETADAAKWRGKPVGQLVSSSPIWTLPPTVNFTPRGPIVSALVATGASEGGYIAQPTSATLRTWKRDAGGTWPRPRNLTSFGASASHYPEGFGGLVTPRAAVALQDPNGIWIRHGGRNHLLKTTHRYVDWDNVMVATSSDGRAIAVGTLAVRKRGGRLILRMATFGEKTAHGRRGLRTYNLDLGHVAQADEPWGCYRTRWRNGCHALAIDRFGRVGVAWTTRRDGVQSVWRGRNGQWGSIETLYRSGIRDGDYYRTTTEALVLAFDERGNAGAQRALVGTLRQSLFLRDPDASSFAIHERTNDGSWGPVYEQESHGDPGNSMFALDVTEGRIAATWLVGTGPKGENRARLNLLNGDENGNFPEPATVKLPKNLRYGDELAGYSLVRLPRHLGFLMLVRGEDDNRIRSRHIVDGRPKGGWVTAAQVPGSKGNGWDYSLGVAADERRVAITWFSPRAKQVRYREFR